jgi:hypothetical protein
MYLGLERLYLGKQNISTFDTIAGLWINVFYEFQNLQ